MPKREAWYSRHLTAAGETPLCTRVPSGEIYRFTWLRTFHQPIVITVGSGPEHYWLRATTLSGQGGYDPGEVIGREDREIDHEQWIAITRLVHALSFWNDDVVDIGASWATDGSAWVLEGRRDEEFRAISRYMPQGGALYDLGVMLMELADVLPDDPREFY